MVLQWLPLAAVLFLAAAAVALAPHAAIVALGSCNRHDADQSYWLQIAAGIAALHEANETRSERSSTQQNDENDFSLSSKRLSADAFFWIGDAVYADTRVAPAIWTESPIEVVKSKYATQLRNPYYQEFISRSVRLVNGVWDDHDLGKNDGGKEFVAKSEVQQIYLDFLQVPLDSPRRRQKGLYSVEKILMPAAHPLRAFYKHSVCAVFLDVRYFRDDWAAEENGDMLGEAQWEMLRKDLLSMGGKNTNKDKDAETVIEKLNTGDPKTLLAARGEGEGEDAREECAVTAIISGVQILMDVMPTEQWSTFGQSRGRLFGLIRCLQVDRVVFVSGDVHFGEIAKFDGNTQDVGIGYPIVELTSSGMTHTAGEFWPLRLLFPTIFPSRRRRQLMLERNFATLVVRGASPADATVELRLHSLDKPGAVALHTELLADLSSSPRSSSEGDARSCSWASAPLRLWEDRDHAPTRMLAGSLLFPTEPAPFVKRLLVTLQFYLRGVITLSQLIYISIAGFSLVSFCGLAWFGLSCSSWARKHISLCGGKIKAKQG
jgi:alkaline phosphatase D